MNIGKFILDSKLGHIWKYIHSQYAKYDQLKSSAGLLLR